jgi:hypothetical protein
MSPVYAARMRPRGIVTFVLVLLAARLVGCGATVTASKYDQSCKFASDCIVVGVGDPCGQPCVQFPSADAIAGTAAASYRLDADDAQYGCGDCGTPLSNCGNNATAGKSAYCNAGTCAVCDHESSCACAPMDSTCGVPGMPGMPDAGMGDAAPDAPVGMDAPPATDAPAESGATDAPNEAGGDGAADAPPTDGAGD